MITELEIVEAIYNVYDPEIPVNIYELGLIYRIDIDVDKVDIRMTLTAPNCPSARAAPFPAPRLAPATTPI